MTTFRLVSMKTVFLPDTNMCSDGQTTKTLRKDTRSFTVSNLAVNNVIIIG